LPTHSQKQSDTQVNVKLISTPIKSKLFSNNILNKDTNSQSNLVNADTKKTQSKSEFSVDNKYRALSSSIKKSTTEIHVPVNSDTTKSQSKSVPSIDKSKLQEFDTKRNISMSQNIRPSNIFSVKNSTQTPDLNKLVNQAFSKMINPANISADKIRTEILSSIQPNLLNKNESMNSFKSSLQDLALSLLVSYSVNQQSEESTNLATKPPQKLDQLLQLIFPGLKTKTTNIIKETNTKPGMALLQELGQIQQTVQLSQQQLIQSQSINNQTDNLSNSILQFLLPMQLAETVKQTEINLGRYKKSKDDGELKDVWFIRLNFDFETLGQLQAHAQLMDKNVECTFLSANQDLIIKAEPYIKMLKLRLIEQGLSVGKMKIEQGGKHNDDIYKQHSIINIKV